MKKMTKRKIHHRGAEGTEEEGREERKELKMTNEEMTDRERARNERVEQWRRKVVEKAERIIVMYGPLTLTAADRALTDKWESLFGRLDSEEEWRRCIEGEFTTEAQRTQGKRKRGVRE